MKSILRKINSIVNPYNCGYHNWKKVNKEYNPRKEFRIVSRSGLEVEQRNKYYCENEGCKKHKHEWETVESATKGKSLKRKKMGNVIDF